MFGKYYEYFLSRFSNGTLRPNHQKILNRISFVFGMIRSCVNYVVTNDRTAPSGCYGPVPGKSLEQPQGILLEGNIEKQFDIVEQDHICSDGVYYIGKKPGQLQCSLTFSEIEHST